MIVTQHIRGRQTSEAQAEVLPSMSRSCSLISPDFILLYFCKETLCNLLATNECDDFSLYLTKFGEGYSCILI